MHARVTISYPSFRWRRSPLTILYQVSMKTRGLLAAASTFAMCWTVSSCADNSATTAPSAAGAVAVQAAKHVLLISIDGLHQLDLANFVASHPNSALAKLTHRGITYCHASTSKPSDSFPGLLAMVTGGSPSVTGVYYDDSSDDDSYDRKLSPPGYECATTGIEVVYHESVDRNPDDNSRRQLMSATIEVNSR